MASRQGGTFTQIKNGPCKITFDGLVLGFTREGVDVDPQGEWADLTVDEGGDTPLDAMRTKEGIEVTMRLPQFSMDILEKIIPGSTRVIDGADEKLTVGQTHGYRARDYAGSLRIHPILAGDADKSQDLLIYKAFVAEGPAWSYQVGEVTMYEVTFRALMDTDRAQGDQVYSLGNDDASADVTPPTVTVVPANDAPGVAVGANIVATFSEAMDQASVLSGDNVFLFALDSETPVAVTLSYNSGTFELTANPNSDLSAATEYEFVIGTGVMDLAGNHLATQKIIHFTTA